MEGCFLSRGRVRVDVSHEIKERKEARRGGEEMGAARFDRRCRMWQLRSEECEISRGPISCVSASASEIPP